MNNRRLYTVLRINATTHYVTDTGPLLCLGYSFVLCNHVSLLCRNRTHWVAAVRDEMIVHAKRQDTRGQAARTFGSTGVSWLIMAPTFTANDEPELAALLARLAQLEAEKALLTGRRPKTHPKANSGEAESILYARRQGYTLLSHDNGAKKVARELGVPAATVVDLVRWLISQGVRAQELAKALQDLQIAKIDTGEHINGVLDLAPRQRH